MVSDARVSRQLALLEGVFRDPMWVNHDASSLLLSSVGSHLTPVAALHRDDSGDLQNLLVLQGISFWRERCIEGRCLWGECKGSATIASD